MGVAEVKRRRNAEAVLSKWSALDFLCSLTEREWDAVGVVWDNRRSLTQRAIGDPEPVAAEHSGETAT